MNALLGGWSIQGFNTYQSGSVYSITSGVRTMFSGNVSRAVLVGNTLPDASLKTKAGVVGPVAFQDASAFAIAPPGETGMGRNMFTGPGYFDIDASISKTFRVRERTEVKFQLEAFNALNTTNYRAVNNATVGSNSILSSNFGTVCCQTRPTATSTAIVSNGEAYRVIQGVLRINW